MNKKLFGTDGIRATVGNYPLTHDMLMRLGNAFAQFALHLHGPNPKIIIAHDTRASCSYIKAHLKAGMLAHPITIYDAGVLPTPAAHKLVHQNPEYAYALVISASHNPYHDNGIKIITRTTGKLSDHDEALIASFLQENPQPNYEQLGIDIPFEHAAQVYQHHIYTHLPTSLLHGLRIVLDCAHGATSSIAPSIFEHLGAHVITINNQPTGKNINQSCGSVHPEELKNAVLAHHADIGFAFDGDGDRLAVVTQSGCLRTGDEQLAFLLQHPMYHTTSTLVSTIMANQGLESYVQQLGKKLVRTAVGDKHVAQAMLLHGSMVGGEPSGHIILSDFIPSSDGIFTALRIVETMLYTKNKELSTFTAYPQITINMPVRHKKELSQEPYAQLIAATQTQFPHGRLVVRYSGTEPLLRLMIEDEDEKKARLMVEQLAQELAKELC